MHTLKAAQENVIRDINQISPSKVQSLVGRFGLAFINTLFKYNVSTHDNTNNELSFTGLEINPQPTHLQKLPKSSKSMPLAYWAILNKRFDIAELLYWYGANFELRAEGFVHSPLCLAVANQNVSLVDTLLKKGASYTSVHAGSNRTNTCVKHIAEYIAKANNHQLMLKFFSSLKEYNKPRYMDDMVDLTLCFIEKREYDLLDYFIKTEFNFYMAQSLIRKIMRKPLINLPLLKFLNRYDIALYMRTKNHLGDSLLSCCAKKGLQEEVDYLISNFSDQVSGALTKCVSGYKFDACKLLLDSAVRLNLEAHISKESLIFTYAIARHAQESSAKYNLSIIDTIMHCLRIFTCNSKGDRESLIKSIIVDLIKNINLWSKKFVFLIPLLEEIADLKFLRSVAPIQDENGCTILQTHCVYRRGKVSNWLEKYFIASVPMFIEDIIFIAGLKDLNANELFFKNHNTSGIENKLKILFAHTNTGLYYIDISLFLESAMQAGISIGNIIPEDSHEHLRLELILRNNDVQKTLRDKNCSNLIGYACQKGWMTPANVNNVSTSNVHIQDSAFSDNSIITSQYSDSTHALILSLQGTVTNSSLLPVIDLVNKLRWRHFRTLNPDNDRLLDSCLESAIHQYIKTCKLLEQAGSRESFAILCEVSRLWCLLPGHAYFNTASKRSVSLEKLSFQVLNNWFVSFEVRRALYMQNIHIPQVESKIVEYAGHHPIIFSSLQPSIIPDDTCKNRSVKRESIIPNKRLRSMQL